MLDVLAEKAKATGVANVEGLLLDLEREKSAPEIRPDAIVSAMAMHHIADTERFAKVLHEMLAAGSKIWFQTAYSITRPNGAGVEKTYTIFLLVARK